MGPPYGGYSYSEPFRVHTWPGQAVVKSSGKHRTARQARFKARHRAA